MQSKLKDVVNTLSISKLLLSDSILVDLTRIEVAPNNELIWRYTFRVEAKRESDCLCGGLKNCEKHVWLQYDEKRGLQDSVDKLWSVDPCVLLDKILVSPNPKEEVLQEITLIDQSKYLQDEVKIGNNQLSELLVKLGYTEKELHKCFLEYLQLTYPSIYMNKVIFQVTFLNLTVVSLINLFI